MIFRCIPVAAGWDISILDPKCSNMLTVMMVLSIANIIMDIAILILPIPVCDLKCLVILANLLGNDIIYDEQLLTPPSQVVIPLQMRKMKKASIILIFATGGL